MVLLGSQEEDWLGQRRESGASYVSSRLDVEVADPPDAVDVMVDLRHTYVGDLKVELLSSWKRWYTLHDRKGGGDNDLRRTFPLGLSAEDRRRSPRGTWRLVVSDHAGRDVGSLDGWSLRLKSAGKGKRVVTAAAADLPKFIPDAPEEDGSQGFSVVEVSPPAINIVASRLGRVVAGRNKQFLRLEVEAAPQLSPLPRQPSVVFVIDASYSIHARKGSLAAQLDVARAFLQHVPDASFEVVVYRRRAKRLLQGFEKAEAFDGRMTAALAQGRFAPGNGSALDRGLALATQALKRRSGPRFVVMASDGLVRSSWKNPSVAPGARSARGAAEPRSGAERSAQNVTARGLVAHVVIPELGGSEVTERRNDVHRLAPLAAARGGVLLEIEGLPVRPQTRKELTRIALGLVRPVRIDSFRIHGPGTERLGDIPDVLHEGDGLREMSQVPRAATRVRLTGKIWARTFTRDVWVGPRFARATAAYIFSHDQHQDLSRAEQMRVALQDRAVSPVTSYLAIEPGVRPSTAGIERVGSGGGSGSGAGYGSGVGRLGGRRGPPDLKGLLMEGVQRCVARHRPAAGWTANLTVETTLDEIVDVTLNSPASDLGRCIVEEAWSTRLTPSFNRERESFAVSVS